MQEYMKSAMPYYGVPGPQQRAIWTRIFRANTLRSRPEWRNAALALWRGAEFREERYAAVALTDLRMYAAYRTMPSVPMFEEMIVSGAWWDFVDAIATHQLGDVLRAEPAPMKRLVRRWARDSNLWKRRAAILSQIRFKGDTDLKLLYDCIEPNLVDTLSTRETPGSRMARQFFIRKAIGWALRQYAWHDPREVKRYVKANRARLSGLTAREALRNL